MAKKQPVETLTLDEVKMLSVGLQSYMNDDWTHDMANAGVDATKFKALVDRIKKSAAASMFDPASLKAMKKGYPKAQTGRVFAPITIAELKAKIEAAQKKQTDRWDEYNGKANYDRYGWSSLTPQVEKDLAKCRFDCENLDDDKEYVYDMKKGGYTDKLTNDPMNKVMGYNTLPNGLTFRGFSAGGDWEYPVFWIVYWDGSKLRGYVPEQGNPWNTDTKEAYGNDEKGDLENAKKRYPDLFTDDADLDCVVEYVKANADLILKDIQDRLQPKA